MTSPRSSAVVFVTLSVIALFTWGFGETVTSPVVGFTSQTVNPGDDSILKVGFHQAPVFSGRLESDPVNLGGAWLFDFSGEPLAGENFQSGTHYVKAIDGQSAGATFEITSNESDKVTVVLGTGGIGLSGGDRVSIIPHWTLETLIPTQEQPASQRATGNFPPDRRLELYRYTSHAGTGFSPSRIFFLTVSGWKESKKGFPDANNEPIAADAVMWLRPRAGVDSWKLVTSGTVNSSDFVTLLKTHAEMHQDTVVGLNRPVPIAINDLGLNDEAVFRSSASTAGEDRLDELHILDNGVSGANRIPSAVYFRTGGEWRSDDAGFPEAMNVLIDSDSGLIVRKAPTENGEPVVWVNHPNYP